VQVGRLAVQERQQCLELLQRHVLVCAVSESMTSRLQWKLCVLRCMTRVHEKQQQQQQEHLQQQLCQFVAVHIHVSGRVVAKVRRSVLAVVASSRVLPVLPLCLCAANMASAAAAAASAPLDIVCNQCNKVSPESNRVCWQSRGVWYATCKTCKTAMNRIHYAISSLDSDDTRDWAKRMLKEDKASFLTSCEGLTGKDLSRYMTVTCRKVETESESREWERDHSYKDEETIREEFKNRPVQMEHMLRADAPKVWVASRGAYFYDVETLTGIEKAGFSTSTARDIAVHTEEKVKRDQPVKKLKDQGDPHVQSRKKQQQKMEDLATKLAATLEEVREAAKQGLVGGAVVQVGEAGTAKLTAAIASVTMSQSPDWTGDHSTTMEESHAFHKEALMLNDQMMKQVAAATKFLNPPEPTAEETGKNKGKRAAQEEGGPSASAANPKKRISGKKAQEEKAEEEKAEVAE
jgi:hypothetical protein